MRTVFRFLGSWLVAALATTVIAMAFQSQNVLQRLNGIGADLGIGPRISMMFYDLIHLGPLYAVFIGLATLVAWLVGAGVYRLAGFGRPIIYAVAGVVAIAVMLWAMRQAFFGIDLIAGSRDTVGYIAQLLAGGLGGLIFAAFSRPKPYAATEPSDAAFA